MAPNERKPSKSRPSGDRVDQSTGVMWDADGRCLDRESHLPAMDMYETGDLLTIELELPGVRREAIEVLVEGQAVYVSAVKTDVGPSAGGRGGGLDYQQVERKYGRYCREVRLPVPCNTREARARFRNGVLVIEFQKLKDRRGERRRLVVE